MRFLGILLIILGFKILFFKQWSGNWIEYDFSKNYIYIIVSFLCLYSGVKMVFVKYNLKDQIEFSICPNCEETYYLSELDNGICPNCKKNKNLEIQTVDIDKYYEDKKKNKKSDNQSDKDKNNIKNDTKNNIDNTIS